MTVRLRMTDIAAALIMSLLLHFVFTVIAGKSQPPVSIEGGAPAAVAALGNNFVDLAESIQTPRDADEEPIEPLPPTSIQAVDPAVAETSEPELQRAVSTVSERSPATPVDAAQPAPASGVKLLPGSAVSVPETAETVLAPVVPAETITALPEGPTPEERRSAKQRAKAEHDRKEAQRKKAREREKAQRAERARREEQRRAQRGAADRNARTGQTDGQRGARSATSANRSNRNVRAGNAAASNYPGRVYAKIRRTKQRSVRGSGTARVSFSVTASGGLGSVRIARSSGNAVIDRAALDHIRRAAPFPRPPPGARRTFVIPVRVR